MTFLARTVRTVAALCLATFGICAVAAAVLSHSPGSTGSRRQSLMVVSSGSMVPVFHAGDAILVRSTDETSRAALRPGRIVTYRAAETGQLVTHRIVSVIGHTDGHTEYVTRGDANPDPDLTPVDATDVVATYQSVVPFGGYVMRVLGDRRVPVLLFIAVLLGNWSVASSVRRGSKCSPVLPGGVQTTHTTKGTTS